MKKITLVISLYSFSFLVNAQDRISADRPDATEGATLTPYHYFQAEFGIGEEHTDRDNFNLIHPNALLKYGVSKRFELQLLGNFHSSYEKMIPSTIRSTGIDPIEIGFRAALWEEKNILPKTSIIARFGIPEFASKSFRADHLAPSILLTMESTITEKIGLSYNIGTGWDGFSSSPSWIYSLSSSFDLGKKWDVFFEVFGSAAKNESSQNNLDTGLGFYINNDVKLDAYFGFGITKAALNNFYGMGISFRFH